MMKTVGIVTIAISILLIGYVRYYKLKTRPDGIELFIKLLTLYRQELEWSRKSIQEVLQDFTFNKFEGYINEVKAIAENDDAKNAFILLNKQFETLYLGVEEKTVLAHFFDESGKSCLSTELLLCDKTITVLENKKQEAIADFKKLGPLSVKLAVVCGAWVGIMLI